MSNFDNHPYTATWILRCNFLVHLNTLGLISWSCRLKAAAQADREYIALAKQLDQP